MELILKTLPLTTNRLYASNGNRRFLRPEGRANKEAIGWEARTQHKGEPLTGSLSVFIEFWWPTRRNHDIDNIKGLLDALTGILWVDDGQIVQLTLMKGYDKENPRVEMRVQELSTPDPK